MKKKSVKKLTCLMLMIVMSIGQINTVFAAQREAASIRVDGYFDDWNGIPHGILTHGSWNGKEQHLAALYVQGDYLYGHIKMWDHRGTQILMNSMAIKVNGRRNIQISTHFIGRGNSIDWSKDGICYQLPVGRTVGLGIFNDSWPVRLMGDAAVTVYSRGHNPGDQFEFRISLQELSEMSGIPVDALNTFTLTAPNLGSGSITTAGTSTGTVIGIVLCITVAGGAYLITKRKRNGKVTV